MRILFLSNFYPPYDIGGYEQWCQEVAVRLIERGHEVSVLTSRHGLKRGSVLNEHNITRTLYLQANNDYYQPAAFFLKRPAEERANVRALREQIDTFRPDIIMVWGMWNLSLNLPYCVEKWMPDRVTYFISNYWPMDMDLHIQYWNLPTKRPLFEGIKRPLRNLALAELYEEAYPPNLRLNNAVCCSQYVRDTLIKAGKLPSNAGVLFGGTDPDPFLKYSRLNGAESTPSNEPTHLLYFGRLIHDKGVHTALEALGQLKQQGLADDNLDLTILGSGHPEYETRLHHLVLKLDIADKVQFVRQIPREQIPEWLGRFDVFLFTSIWPEPMARSVMEAMAAGLLVIGSEVGGQVEMLSHGQNALTFKAEDSKTLASHIAAVAQDPALRIRLARAGQQMVLEKFTLKRMVDEIEQFLETTAKSSASPMN